MFIYIKLIKPFIANIVGYRSSCRYSPTCSQYSYQAVKVHGLVKGLTLSLARILRCNPLFRSGFDPVPKADKIN